MAYEDVPSVRAGAEQAAPDKPRRKEGHRPGQETAQETGAAGRPDQTPAADAPAAETEPSPSRGTPNGVPKLTVHVVCQRGPQSPVLAHALWISPADALRGARPSFLLCDEHLGLAPITFVRGSQVLAAAGLPPTPDWRSLIRVVESFEACSLTFEGGLTLQQLLGTFAPDDPTEDAELEGQALALDAPQPVHPPPSTTVRVYATFHRADRTVRGLWVNPDEVMGRGDSTPWFLLTDEAYQPVQPPAVIKGLKLTELTGMVNGGNWRKFIKLGEPYVTPGGVQFPQGAALVAVLNSTAVARQEVEEAAPEPVATGRPRRANAGALMRQLSGGGPHQSVSPPDPAPTRPAARKPQPAAPGKPPAQPGAVNPGAAVRVLASCQRPLRQQYALWINAAQVQADPLTPPLFVPVDKAGAPGSGDPQPVKGWKLLQQAGIAFGGQWAKSVRLSHDWVADSGLRYGHGTSLLKARLSGVFQGMSGMAGEREDVAGEADGPEAEGSADTNALTDGLPATGGQMLPAGNGEEYGEGLVDGPALKPHVFMPEENDVVVKELAMARVAPAADGSGPIALRVAARFHRGNTVVRGLWINWPEVMRGEPNTLPLFVLAEGPAFTPRQPLTVVRGLKLTELTGMVNGGNWRRFIKLEQPLSYPDVGDFASSTSLHLVMERIKPMDDVSIAPVSAYPTVATSGGATGGALSQGAAVGDDLGRPATTGSAAPPPGPAPPIRVVATSFRPLKIAHGLWTNMLEWVADARVTPTFLLCTDDYYEPDGSPEVKGWKLLAAGGVAYGGHWDSVVKLAQELVTPTGQRFVPGTSLKQIRRVLDGAPSEGAPSEEEAADEAAGPNSAAPSAAPVQGPAPGAPADAPSSTARHKPYISLTSAGEPGTARVYCTFHRARQTVFAVWTNFQACLEGTEATPMFTVAGPDWSRAGASLEVVKGLRLTARAGIVNGGNWRKFIKLGQVLTLAPGVTLAPHTHLDKVLDEIAKLRVGAMAAAVGAMHGDASAAPEAELAVRPLFTELTPLKPPFAKTCWLSVGCATCAQGGGGVQGAAGQALVWPTVEEGPAPLAGPAAAIGDAAAPQAAVPGPAGAGWKVEGPVGVVVQGPEPEVAVDVAVSSPPLADPTYALWVNVAEAVAAPQQVAPLFQPCSGADAPRRPLSARPVKAWQLPGLLGRKLGDNLLSYVRLSQPLAALPAGTTLAHVLEQAERPSVTPSDNGTQMPGPMSAVAPAAASSDPQPPAAPPSTTPPPSHPAPPNALLLATSQPLTVRQQALAERRGRPPATASGDIPRLDAPPPEGLRVCVQGPGSSLYGLWINAPEMLADGAKHIQLRLCDDARWVPTPREPPVLGPTLKSLASLPLRADVLKAVKLGQQLIGPRGEVLPIGLCVATVLKEARQGIAPREALPPAGPLLPNTKPQQQPTGLLRAHSNAPAPVTGKRPLLLIHAEASGQPPTDGETALAPVNTVRDPREGPPPSKVARRSLGNDKVASQMQQEVARLMSLVGAPPRPTASPRSSLARPLVSGGLVAPSTSPLHPRSEDATALPPSKAARTEMGGSPNAAQKSVSSGSKATIKPGLGHVQPPPLPDQQPEQPQLEGAPQANAMMVDAAPPAAAKRATTLVVDAAPPAAAPQPSAMIIDDAPPAAAPQASATVIDDAPPAPVPTGAKVPWGGAPAATAVLCERSVAGKAVVAAPPEVTAAAGEAQLPPLPPLAFQPDGQLTPQSETQVMAALPVLLRWLGAPPATTRQLWQRYRRYYVAGGAATMREFALAYTELTAAMALGDRGYVEEVVRTELGLEV